jgi:DNA-binding helix-hairpin-helix protein with protein kinase domain
VADLFERAFGRAAIGGEARPSAGEWTRALDALEARLATCPDDPRHAHAQPRGACPWCRIENDGGPSFFFLPPGAAPDAFDAQAAWRSIEAVESPGRAALPELAEPEPAAEGLATAALRALRNLVGDVALRASARVRGEHAREQEAIAACVANLHRLAVQWQELCGDAAFGARRRQLDAARAELANLKALEEREWDEVTERYRDKRLAPYLSTFPLEFARLPGLGPAELDRLASRGIKTAADVTPEKLMTIRRIDLELVRALLLYRGLATRAFRFDPVTGIPGRERKALADRQARRRAELVKRLQAGPLELAEVRRQTLAWRETIGKAFHEQQRRLAELRSHAVWTAAPGSARAGRPVSEAGDRGARPAGLLQAARAAVGIRDTQRFAGPVSAGSGDSRGSSAPR